MRTALLALAIGIFCNQPAVHAGEVTSSQVRTLKRRLALLAKGQREAGLNDLILELAELDDPRTAVLVPRAAAAVPSAANHAEAVRAISRYRRKETVEALAELLEKRTRDYRQKVVVLDGFAERDDPESLEAIISSLEDPVPQVAVAAIRAAAGRRAKEPIPHLIDLLEKTWKRRDRIWLETYEALHKLTGQSFETIEDWRKFWLARGETFDPKTVGEEKGKTRVAVKKTKDSVEFFGSEIFSRNVIFVIDVSGSMLMFDESSDYKGKDVEIARQRLNRAKEQLIAALKKLPRGARFNIIAFSDRVIPWQKRLTPASPSSIASAVRFVKGFKAQGATHTDEALEKAFEDLSVDTVVLLSDGAPMSRKVPRSDVLIERILKWLRDVNPLRKVRIDTFGFEGVGRWPEKVPFAPRRPPPPPTPEDVKRFVAFLKTLAEETGGEYRPIR